MNVLLAPAEFSFLPSNYSVSYNLLKRINAKFYVFVSKVDGKVKLELDKAQFYELNTSFLWYPFKLFLRAKKLLTNTNVDLIHHLSPFAIGKDFNLLCLANSKPFIIGPIEIPHQFFDDEYFVLRIPTFASLFKDSRLRQALSAKTLRGCDIAVAVNMETKKFLLNFVDREKIKVIPLGVDLSLFKYSPPPKNFDILTVGTHIKRKGIDYLIRAMPKILKVYPAKLHITSTGPQTQNLKILINRLNLNNSIFIHGRVSNEEIVNLYKRCRVFCHPSLSEGFSHVKLEAMASGRPVVATYTPGADGMIENGKTGFLVPIKDSDSIADAILRIFDSYELTYKMGIEGRKKAEKYDWDVIAKRYYEAYQEIV